MAEMNSDIFLPILSASSPAEKDLNLNKYNFFSKNCLKAPKEIKTITNSFQQN